MSTSSLTADLQTMMRDTFHREGHCSIPGVVPQDLISHACERMDAVMAGEHATGVPPFYSPVSGPNGLHKIDQVHLSDPVLRAVCTHPAIGAWAAHLTGGSRIQLWAVQMLFKPPGGGDHGAIGFHQDRWYWQYWSEDSEVFTAWVALSDVTSDAGPMCFVPHSHTWGTLAQPAGLDFSGSRSLRPADIAGIPAGSAVAEVPALLAPGGVSFHHRLMIHGSSANHSPHPRRALALHLRTERSQPVPGANDYYVSHLDDPAHCPVIYPAPDSAAGGSG